MIFIHTPAPKPLYLVCGIECSGKSTFADYLHSKEGYGLVRADHVPLDIRDFLYGREAELYSSDLGIREQFASAGDGEEKLDVFYRWITIETIMRIFENLRTGEGAILDGKLPVPESRTILLQAERAIYRGFSPSAYWMDTDRDECIRRFKDRKNHELVGEPGVVLTEDMIAESHAKAIPPGRGEGFEHINFVRGTSPEEYEIRTA